MTAGPSPPSRLVSLDVLRGLTVIGMILVNVSAGFHYGDRFEVYPLLLHARWDGLTLADLVFPAFLMIVGVSIPLARRSERGERPSGVELRRIGWRTVRLFALGLLLSNLYWLQDSSASDWRLWGVLQRIGLVYGICAVLYLLVGSRFRMVLILAMLALYWPLSLLPSLDGSPTDIWEPGANFVASVDRLMLGEHNFVKGAMGYDPEGLLGTIPAIAHGLIGVAVGEFLFRHRGCDAAWRLASAGLTMLIVGIGWAFAFPVIKDIWSSSFVLVTCGLTTLALALLHGGLDGNTRYERALGPIISLPVAFGVNAIAAYVLHALAGPMVGWRSMLAPADWASPFVGERSAALIPVVLFIAVIGLCMIYLRRRNWIIRI